jgi:hypothetical protein
MCDQPDTRGVSDNPTGSAPGSAASKGATLALTRAPYALSALRTTRRERDDGREGVSSNKMCNLGAEKITKK